MNISQVTLENISLNAIKIILIFILSKILIIVLANFTKKFFAIAVKNGMSPSKGDTLISLSKSIIKYVVYAIVIFTILSIFNFPINSLLAAAGFGSVAIGFGAQSLIKDIVSGFFILFENQYSVGDYIKIKDMAGTVEKVELRITRFRGFAGELYIIPNGEIKEVINYSRGNSTAIIDMPLSYDSDINLAMNIMETEGEKYYKSHDDITKEYPKILGVTNIDPSHISIRIVVKTAPLSNYQVERDLKKIFLEAFKRENVKIPQSRLEIIEKFNKK